MRCHTSLTRMRVTRRIPLLGVWLMNSFSFFFQAEDGIRDHCVTGVQTCALPICGGRAGESRALVPRSPLRLNGIPDPARQDPPPPPVRLSLPGHRPRNFRLADGNEADGALFPAHLGDRLPLRVLLHPHRHSVRLVLLHRFDPRPGVVSQQHAVHGLTVVLVPPVYELLPGPGLSPAGPWPWAVLA